MSMTKCLDCGTQLIIKPWPPIGKKPRCACGGAIYRTNGKGRVLEKGLKKGRKKTRFLCYCKACDFVQPFKQWAWRFDINTAKCQKCRGPVEMANTAQAKLGRQLYPSRRKKKRDWYHDEYLQSDLWKTIRQRVLTRDGFRCVVCQEPTNIVHHKSYDPAVIAGQCDKELVSICGDCHSAIEFKEDGNKASLKQANARLAQLLSRSMARA